jgi:hypothetical protein
VRKRFFIRRCKKVLDTSESFYRANGGLHYADAVYRKHAPTTNYVRYIVKLINQNLFAGENVLMCYQINNRIRINYRGEYFLLLSLGWVEGFRKIKATSLEGYIIQHLKKRQICFDRSSYYYRNWISNENSVVVR